MKTPSESNMTVTPKGYCSMQLTVRRRQFSAGMAAAILMQPLHAQVAEGGNIAIGQSAVLSGPFSSVGQLQVAGTRLAFDEFNNKPNAALGRRKIDLHTFDDGYSAQRSVENTRRLIDNDVLALFGYTGTAASIASMELAVRARVPFFSPFTGALELRQPFNRQVFHVRPSYAEEVGFIIRQVLHLGIQRIGIVRRGDAYGSAVQNGVLAALSGSGLEPVIDIVITEEQGAEGVSAAVQKLLTAKPQAILQANIPAICASFVRELRQAGYGGSFYHLSIIGAEALVNTLKAQAQGLMMSQVVPSPYKRTHPLARDFLQAIQKYAQGSLQPNYLSMEAYFSARVLIEGLRMAYLQSGKLTREALINGLESIKRRIADVPIAYSASNHEGSRFMEMSMLTGDGQVRV